MGLIKGDTRSLDYSSYAIMEKKMETLGPFKGICRVIGIWGYWGHIGITEKKMETSV